MPSSTLFNHTDHQRDGSDGCKSMLHIATTTGSSLLHSKCDCVFARQLASLPLFVHLAEVMHLGQQTDEHRLSSLDANPLETETGAALWASLASLRIELRHCCNLQLLEWHATHASSRWSEKAQHDVI